MGENSAIEWTHHTFNPWWGCTKVSDGCKHCYAETLDRRTGGGHWGPKATRRLTKDANWNKPRRWDRAAAQAGRQQRVFCASMADVFDDHPSIASKWRDRLWSLIDETPNLDWLLLTKRPENIKRFLPTPMDPWPNVRLGVTVEHQDAAALRLPYLAFAGHMGWKTFVSYEPALGPVDWWPWLDLDGIAGGAIGWIVAGGESGHGARPPHPDWFRQCRDACKRAGVPFLFKQWGAWVTVYDRDHDDPDWRRCPKAKNNNERYVNLEGGHGFHGERVVFSRRVSKKAAGRILDGQEHLEFPDHD